ncbi:MAG: hypothetical protein OHK0046_39730 [Anaerolineae bacterium]
MATQSLRPTLFNSRRGRILLENITAYLFLAPAGLLIFIFGIFPVGFAFFVSLHRWRRFPEENRGLDTYVDALGNLAYVLFFWIAIGLLVYGLISLWHLYREAREDWRGLLYIVPAAASTALVLAFTNWFFILLPVVLDVPRRLRGERIEEGTFVNEFLASFRFPNVLAAADTFWLTLLVAVVLTGAFVALIRTPRRGHYLFVSLVALLALSSGVLFMQLTLAEIDTAIAEARANNQSLPIWSQIILISAGVGLLYTAYLVWQQIHTVSTNRRFFLQALAVILLMVGGVVLIVELPQALNEADEDIMRGFSVTIMYSIFSIPLQLSIGLGLAVLLFQKIKFKSLFRVIYFMPYITPFVASSVVFTLLFSHRTGSPANRLLTLLGIETQNWLLEPKGIFEIIFGPSTPEFLAGPGLALMVIILFNVWVYAGYSTVIFLAGLGNIPQELYEAARIDGASGWSSFRFITLPLLSPTTFFLTLIATIGTFQAFTQIFLLRRAGAYASVDTINLYIYQEISGSNPDYAYGSAMAFVLFAVILALTLFQNRFVGRRVFYG